MESIFSNDAPKEIGPYAHAIVGGSLLFCSGQTPIDPLTMKIEVSDIESQTSRVLQNLQSVLHAGGLTLQQVVKTNVYLLEMSHFSAMNKVYESWFGDHRPARTTIAVKSLPLDALVEIECIAEYKN